MRDDNVNKTRRYDAESGLYHYRARSYSPDIGRFMQQDPAGMIDGPNMYAYVGNNPVNRVDPSGKWVKETPPDCWDPERIDPRTGEPVPFGMYYDPDYGEIRPCQHITTGPGPHPHLDWGIYSNILSNTKDWIWDKVKRYLSPTPGPGFDYRPPIGGGGPEDRWKYIGNIGARMNIYHR